MYFDALVVFVTSQTLLFRLALAILCSYWLGSLLKFEIHKNLIFPNQKKNEPMRISAPYFVYNQEFWNIQFP
jgi:hypothetical protein